MARIIDKDTRIIDIDFGPLAIGLARTADELFPTNLTQGLNGREQLLNVIDAPNYGAGSFIQYQRLDLSYMAQNNEVMMPVEVNVQRTSPVPLGSNVNGNNFEQLEEYVYILSAPLNNHNLSISTLTNYEALRSMGLDRCEIASTASAEGNLGGNAGWPNQGQCVYAEKRMYSYNENSGASVTNGQLVPKALPAILEYNSLFGMPTLDYVTSWGGMGAITGPNLHCYRVVINRAQSFSPAIADLFTNVPLAGIASYIWPPVNIRFLCKDPNFTEGEYLTRVANAMNKTAEGGPTE